MCLLWKYPRMNVTDLTDDICSGDGLVMSVNTQLPKPVYTQIYVAIWHH